MKVIVAVMVDQTIVEINADHLWPFIPRVGDVIEWAFPEEELPDHPSVVGRWEGVVREVNVNLDPRDSDADVWIGMKDERRIEE